ncbi:hypothetical protein PROFUN_00654 [Planoprotostelium fungivorum]|uniref:Protein kinase domain-containing protein n=1 Tax=Planoprotostelium fungivorum TaxID=1890364 RepID=A0A2P6MZB5_9EUKA|nr:hypothetical protein PROFUN_14639 [Planoprotostelium fungivorum]PRP87443.1 hypothetical protein PROFUN_00654 [Planoprotostelium fungivorum]
MELNLKRMQMTPQISHFKIKKRLGSGSFGTVFSIEDKQGRSWALKRVAKKKQKMGREISIQARVNHKNCLPLSHWFFSTDLDGNLWQNTVMPLMSMSLCRYLKANKFLSQPLTQYVFTEILKGLEYLHSQNLCHRDVTPSNILLELRHDAISRVVISDFGASAEMEEDALSRRHITYITARNYRAPELFLGVYDYGLPVDLWSIGCILFECSVGSPAFSGKTDADHLRDMFSVLGSKDIDFIILDRDIYEIYQWDVLGKDEEDEEYVPDHLHERLKDLIHSLLVYVPAKRLKALAHPFFSCDLSDFA